MSVATVKKPTPKHELKHWAVAYGRKFEPVRDQNGRAVRALYKWEIEAHCFLACMGWHPRKAPPPPRSPGELRVIPGIEYTKEDGDRVKLPDEKVHTGAIHHFIELSNIFFSDPRGIWFFQWSPWAMQMLEDKILYRRYVVAGPASSGKTRLGVLWGILNWFIDPEKTKVLVTSTTKAAAKSKVWGNIVNAFKQIEKLMTSNGMTMPGKWLKSQDKIIFEDNGRPDSTAGLELVPGAESEADASVDKLQGIKQNKLIFIADEFATIAIGVWNTAKSNLSKNPIFDFMGMFNPGSHYDTAGIFSRPVDVAGWDSINIDSESWMGAEGFVRRLDGEKSPNAQVLIAEAEWLGLISMDMLAADAERYGGRNTSEYHRMCRGFWPTAGVIDTIFAEVEFDKWQGGMLAKDIKWTEPPVPACGFDPAFVHGGDLAAAAFGLCGWVMDELTKTRKKVLAVTEIVILADDTRLRGSKIDQAIAALIRECQKRKVDPRHVAIDETGNIAVSSLLAREWSNDFLRVQFSSKATDTPISLDNPTPASEEYANRASELWYSVKPLLRAGQFKIGNQPEVIREMSLRTYKRKGDKIAIESKEDMKVRLNGKSPDRGDSVCLLADVCRQRLGLTSREKPGKISRPQTPFNAIQQYLQPGKRPQNLWNYGPSLKESGPKWS